MKVYSEKLFFAKLLTGSVLCLLFLLHLSGGLLNNLSSIVFRSTNASQSAVYESALVSNNTKPEVLKNVIPVTLVIPAIKINAKIEIVGLTPKGAMEVPSTQFNVGLYKYGPMPGQKGSSVIDGHIGFKGGSVFDNLHKLRKADKIHVEDGNGLIVNFAVRELRYYDSNAVAPEVFWSATGKHLNLIACSGVWVKANKSYSKRLVVFADIVE